MAVINGNYKEYKLENGLVVALQNTPTQTVFAKLRVNQGAYNELPGEEGMAHFLEHCLVTAGSKKYDPVKADLLRSSLGYTNAFTKIGRTFFVGEMLGEDLGIWLDYTSDHIFNPRFDEARVNGERGRVLREISDQKSNPYYKHQKEFSKIFYQDHPKSIEVLGEEEVVKNANLEKIVSFHSRGFSPNNMELILVGGLPENTPEIVNNLFGNYPLGNDTRKVFPELKPLNGVKTIHVSAPEAINIKNPDESTAGISLCYVGPKSGDLDSYSFAAMNYILGGDTKALLFQSLGLKEGLAYSAATSYNGSYNAGEAYVSAGVPANKINNSIDSIFRILDTVKKEKISNEEMNRLKRIMKYTQAKDIESNEGHLNAIEDKLDGGVTPEMSMKRWDDVSPDSIMEVANKYLPKKDGDYVLYIRDPLKK